MHLKYAEMLPIVVHGNINSDQKLANCSLYFTALQDINILETQSLYTTTRLISKISNVIKIYQAVFSIHTNQILLFVAIG